MASERVGEVPFFDLSRQHAELGRSLTDPVQELLLSGDCVLGPSVGKLEQAVAAHSGTAFAVGLSSGTDALLAVLMSLGVGPGDEVVTTPFTFAATAQAIARLGAVPVFADIDPRTLNLDPESAEAACGPRTRAILAVHLFGLLAEVERLSEICAARGIHLVEDAAQAFGASRSGRAAGSWGIAGCHSFYPTKVLGAAGDAGAACTSDPSLADRIRRIRVHGTDASGTHGVLGGNFRLDSLQARILLSKLPGLDARLAARRRNAREYLEALAGSGLELPAEDPRGVRVWSQFCVRHPRRDALRAHLREQGVGTAVYYPRPLHREPCFAGSRVPAGGLPAADAAAREILALPVFPELRDDERERTIEAVLSFPGGEP
jgi:dTDP-4-amino-4,6-dideoxygalactose transaminase